MEENLKYFNGDELAASVWLGKYALKDLEGNHVEKTPNDMHWRMANELGRIERKYFSDFNIDELSDFGKHLQMGYDALREQKDLIEYSIFDYFKDFKYIIPQGSIMSGLGDKYRTKSLSNCFVIPPPYDSYGGIFKTDQEIAQLEKRRGGVGTNLNTLRPDDTPVLNAAGTSTGAHSFMDRYSNTTREVAQNGRRGALMLLMSVLHPDIFKFVGKKKDRTKVTGANVSVQLTDEFMEAVKEDKDFLCRFPIDTQIGQYRIDDYNKLESFPNGVHVMKIKARELFSEIVLNAWENAEPGLAYMDTVINYSPEGVYEQFKPIASNPCGEQWMQAYDACRLLALNLFSVVNNPFTSQAEIDWDKLYEIAYIQQRLADDIVDLEIEYVNNIIIKIGNDPEPNHVKRTELELWTKIKTTAEESRRTGCGFTALGDMLAALGLKYDSPEALEVTEKVMKAKMEAELDCSIDLAILRGTFKGWDSKLEFNFERGSDALRTIKGNNDFYQMLVKEFPEQVSRMVHYGRRNCSWSTVAPTGSVSILTGTTSGVEPLFLPFYMRRKKVNPSDKGVRVDFVDQSGDNWQEYPILHSKFKDWLSLQPSLLITDISVGDLSKAELEDFFKQSPWFGACANDIAWDKRIDMQAIVQKYTTNAISSTMNLPSDVTKETVESIYFAAWEKGLKGVTIYRDGCRSGVLVSESKVKTDEFGYTDAAKRPKELQAQLHVVTVKGEKYGVAVGILDNHPYEVFAFPAKEDIRSVKGRIVKVKRGHYDFLDGDVNVKNLQSQALHADEQVLTRLVSGMLRHGTNPYFIIEQINKTPLEVVSFGKALTRILKQYIKEDELKGKMKCNECESTNIRLQEGCSVCQDCGSSKCG